MSTVTDNSVLFCYRGGEDSFSKVVKKIKKADLPIETEYNMERGSMTFYYTGKCDSNTAHYLTKIVEGLIWLYIKEVLEHKTDAQEEVR